VILLVLILLTLSGYLLLRWISWTPGASYRGPLPPLSPEEREIERNLRRHVEALAGRIGERHVWRCETIKRAERYLREELQALGYPVNADGQESFNCPACNLEVSVPGERDGIVVFGAHYDTVYGSPGANDNGSGVAALLELARLFRDQKPERTVRFLFFVNEEAPFFGSSEMGSYRYAQRAKRRGERIVAMFSLETMGYFTDEPKSQRFPFPLLRFFYPTTGDFIGFVTNIGSRSLMHAAIAAFRRHANFPSEGIAAPTLGPLSPVAWSDHWAFWKAGYPAVMVTDTAFLRYPHYHRPSDTPEKLTYDRLARVVWGLFHLLLELATPHDSEGEGQPDRGDPPVAP